MISKFSVKKPYTVLVGVVLAIVLGVVSFTRMTADLLPNINLPYIIIMTTYPGASPETVETVVTQPVEAAMATVSNIEGISSISNENYSVVILEFAQSANMDSVSLEIRESLDQIEGYWDDSIGSPIMIKMNPDMLPVMIAAVGSEGMDNAQVSEFTSETIVPELESIEGVASVSTIGLLEESVNVVIRQDKIDKMNELIFAAIDEKMADAEAELADGKQTILDSQKEMANAKAELVKGQNEIKNGKTELENGKTELEKGKKELEDKQASTTAQLATQKTALLSAKSQLESTQSTLRMVKELNKKLAEVGISSDSIANMLSQIEARIVAVDDNLAKLDNLSNCAENYQNALTAGNVDEINALKTEVMSNETLKQAAASNEQLALMFENLENLDWTDSNNAVVIYGSLSTIQNTLIPSAKTGLNIQKQALASLKEQVSSMTSVTNGVNISDFEKNITEELKKQGITDLDKAISDLNKGLTALEQGEMTAAIEFANGKAQISLGEYKMELAESQLDSAQAQIDSGWDSLKSGEEQLSDALEQVNDGEKQLADAKETAYDSADLTGILTVETVEGLLTAQNFSMPAGYVTEEGISYLIRVGDKPSTVEELSELPLIDLHMEGVPVIKLSDVADVFYADNSDEIYTNVNGNVGVMLTIQKQTGYSTGAVSDLLLDKFDELMEQYESLSIITLMDQGIYIDLVMDSIINNILFGAVLAIFILIVFLKDLRPTIVIAFSIPISLVTAIVCMYFSGITLNVISLSGLALGIGMLVDNSIVVIENIYRLRSEGYSMIEAAMEGAREVAGAIMASTLTTICVFLPIVFTDGITRQLFVDMGLTIAYSLLASLIIALTVVPAMSSKILTKTKEQKDSKFFGALAKGYERFLEVALKFKPIVMIVVLVLLIVSVVAAMSNGTAFMSDMDSTQLTVNVKLGEDATLEETAEITDKVVEAIRTIDDVQDVGAMISSSSLSLLGGGGNNTTNATSIYVVTYEDKKLTNEEIADIIIDKTKDLEAEITVDASSMDMTALGGSGITIEVRGRDIDTLQEIAKSVAGVVETVEGTANVDAGLGDTDEELRVIVDRDKSVKYGLTVAQVFTQVYAKLADASATTTLVADNRDYSVYVMSGEDIALTRQLVKEIEIKGTDEEGKSVTIPLSDVADFETAESMTSINRVDQTRYVSVTAEIAEGYNVGLVATDVEEALADYVVPDGYKLVFNGENEMINDAMKQVMLMLLLALVFMYLIMVAQFQSLLSPFIIMFTIPLAFTGGFFGLFFAGCEISVIALIGFVMLSGIIVNNGIVLVDYANQLRESGMERRDAVLTAGRTRLRPVLMTALTTILALSTMVFSNDMGSEMAKPMALVTIGGLVYGTILTLIVIPCIYDSFMKLGEKKRKSVVAEVVYDLSDEE